MRWIKRGLAAIAGLIVLALAVLYGGSALKMSAAHAVPLEKIAVPSDAASVAEGARIAKIAGCRHCHGSDGQGAVLAEDAMLGRIAAPGFADIGSRYSNEELARAVRHGLRRDGTSLYIMPTQSHRHMADADVGKVIAWIRTVKPGPKDSAKQTSFGPVGRLLVLSGAIPPAFHEGKVAEAVRPADTGRYFVETICMGCHALDKELPAHDGKGMAPALAPVAAAYDDGAFHTLITTGKGVSKPDLGLMAEVSRESFSAFTPEEIAAIHAYLKGEAAKQTAK